MLISVFGCLLTIRPMTKSCHWPEHYPFEIPTALMSPLMDIENVSSRVLTLKQSF
jgi:hypothetical protein